MSVLFEAARDLQTLLEQQGWRFCFIGGLAVLRWGEPRFTRDMPVRTKASTRSAGKRTVRQSVTIPASLATVVRRVAKERHLTISGALVSLAQRGLQTEFDAKQALGVAYQRFVDEGDLDRKSEAGKDLIRTIFGNDAIAKNSVR